MKTPWLERPGSVKKLLWGLYLSCALLVVLDFVVHRHLIHPWEALPGFYALYGFVSCVALVLAARVLRRLVMRPEDYYDNDHDRP